MKEKSIHLNLIVGPILRGLAFEPSQEEVRQSVNCEDSDTQIDCNKINKSDRTLMITTDLQPTLGIPDHIVDFEILTLKSGGEAVKLSIYEVLNYMNQVSEEEARPIMKRIANGYKDEDVCAEWFIQDAKYYLAVKKLMKIYQCNIYLAPCHELYQLEIPQSRNLVLCITHALLEKEGITCGCIEHKQILKEGRHVLAYA